jgi:hypothetical protein
MCLLAFLLKAQRIVLLLLLQVVVQVLSSQHNDSFTITMIPKHITSIRTPANVATLCLALGCCRMLHTHNIDAAEHANAAVRSAELAN